MLVGCSQKSQNAAATDARILEDGSSSLLDGSNPLVAGRPYTLKVPSGYSANTTTPLLIVLHGYGATAAVTDSYLGATALSTSKTFLLALPEGTTDTMGNSFWNATDACCNLYGSTVDDVAYLNAVVDDVQAKYNVDSKRVYVVGHSNGGFMANRLACDSSARFAGIASLAGAQWKDATKCTPAGPVSVVQIHGDADASISYNGGTTAVGGTAIAYPSAHDTVATWATKNGCTPGIQSSGTTLDLEATLPGAETAVDRFSGCPANGAVELWTIHGGSHIPNFQPTFLSTVYDFLSAHPKP